MPLHNALSAAFLLLLLLMISGADGHTAGLGDHQLSNNSRNVELSKGWDTTSSMDEVKKTYGDCAKNVGKDQDNKFFLKYAKDTPAATTGCTFDFLSSKPFLDFKVEIKGGMECLEGVNKGEKKDKAKASGKNALPFAINVVDPRDGALCFERYKCQDDDERGTAPCGKTVKEGSESLCQVGCLHKPLYELSWARNGDQVESYMTMVGDPMFCQMVQPDEDVDGNSIRIEFKRGGYDFKGKGSNIEYKGNYRAYCLQGVKLPYLRNWNITGPVKGQWLTTIHLMPQSVLYQRSLPNDDYNELKLTEQRDEDDTPKCEMLIKFDGFYLLHGPAGSQPHCGGMEWWLIAIIVTGSLLILEIIAFALWLYFVRWPFVKKRVAGVAGQGAATKTTKRGDGSKMKTTTKAGGATTTKTKKSGMPSTLLTKRIGTKKGTGTSAGGTKMTGGGGKKPQQKQSKALSKEPSYATIENVRGQKTMKRSKK